MRAFHLFLKPLSFFVLVLPFAAIAKPTTEKMSKEVKIATFDFCPYQCPNLAGRPGIMTEAAKLIFTRAGYTVKMIQTPFARALKGTEEGTYDAILSLNSLNSKTILLSKEKAGFLDQRFYTHKDSTWKYEGPESLQKIKIATIAGYNYTLLSPELQKHISDNEKTGKVITLTGSEGPQRAFMMILSKRITTFNEAKSVFEFFTHETKTSQKFRIDASLGGCPLWSGFSPQGNRGAMLRDIFDNGIRDLRKSGELNEILAKYGVSDWGNNKNYCEKQSAKSI